MNVAGRPVGLNVGGMAVVLRSLFCRLVPVEGEC